jgi:hypothetical protein
MLGFLAPPPDIRQPVIILEDRGGIVDTYEKALIKYNLENRRVEIRGSCHSACTLALGVKNVCVGKGAIVRWHHAYNSYTGEPRADVTKQMLSQIPFKISQSVGPHISINYTEKATLNYAQLLQLGIPDCDGATQTIQASITTTPTHSTTNGATSQKPNPAPDNSTSKGSPVYATPPVAVNSPAEQEDSIQQKLVEFDVAYGDALTISTRQNGAPAKLKNCDARRCEEIVAYYDRKGQYVELHKSLNSSNRVICRLSRAGLFEDDYNCLNWLTGLKLAYHWSRDPLY